MAKALIITEKPSVARDLVAALGGFDGSSKQGYWESDRFLCTFAVGHLLELLSPEDIDPAYKHWSLAHLPIVPARFSLKPIREHQERLSTIRALATRADVDRLINACDAAREGELIFREIVAFLGVHLPIERLWLQSMTPEAIRASFARVRPGEQLRGLADAAACRAKTDWLIGMNATRAFSKRLSRPGEAGAWSVGRVQTPTLALLVERELAILAHDPKPYFQIKAKLDAGNHTYDATWFDPQFKKPPPGSPDDGRRDDRIGERSAAEAILAALAAGTPGKATETRDQSARQAPHPFDLTALQKHMATRYKWTAKRTLEAAQRCYEAHKVITYPRTGSQNLPSDYEDEVRRVVERLADSTPYAEHAAKLLANGFENKARIFDDAGITDHFAIVPTGRLAPLDGDEAKLFDAVVRRFLAAFFPPAIFDRVRRVSQVGGHRLRTGPVETLAKAGWMSVTGLPQKDAVMLPALSGTDIKVAGAKLLEEATKPPQRIAEAGLLSLMEHAGRQVDDEELRAALTHAEGLGTPATRADIIQNLKTKGYVDQELRPTFKGVHLIETLRRIGVARLTSAELTARLELELAEVEQGKRQSARFMEEISQYVTEVVAAAKAFDLAKLYLNLDELGCCPACREGRIVERAVQYVCSAGCRFAFTKDVTGRYLDRKSVRSLLEKGETGVIEGLCGKGRPGALALRNGQLVVQSMDAAGALTEEPLASPATPPERRENARGGASVFAARCPIHATDCQVIETRGAWMCTTRLAQLREGAAEPVGAFLPKTVCGRQLSPADATAFLAQGGTGELKGFLSRAGKKFDARIIMRPGGAWAFDFPQQKR